MSCLPEHDKLFMTNTARDAAGSPDDPRAHIQSILQNDLYHSKGMDKGLPRGLFFLTEFGFQLHILLALPARQCGT